MRRSDDNPIVYSTDGDNRAWNERARPKPSVPAKGANVPDDGVIRVARERRRASAVTLVTGLGAEEIESVAKALKRRCGTGGTAKNGVVEIQGDHRDTIVAYFTDAGRRVKKAGG